MKATQSRQKSYADKRRRPLTFEVGDYVYLKVSPMKGVQRFRVKRKLAPRYVGLYKIIEWKENVAYKLQLPPEMSAIFDVFHVSQLKRCLRIPEEAIAPTNIELQSDLTYEEKPIRVLEEMERVTQSKVIKFYKVVWNNHSEQDATWEQEDYLHEVYPKDGNGSGSDRMESPCTQNRNPKSKPKSAPKTDSGGNPSPKPNPRIPADTQNPNGYPKPTDIYTHSHV